MEGHSSGEGVSIQDYVDSRVNDLRVMHQGHIESLQAEIDRRITAFHEELNLRFSQQTNRMNGMDDDRESIHDHLSRIDATIERQRGRMAAYATISAIVLIFIAIASLFLDHVI